mmetsp:Transcript_5136/g.16466  ORF Transcript_5136/g.16466 Transcript_5136/m.16466 type:complete len:201 (+) Transcript_5136:349-951(+)
MVRARVQGARSAASAGHPAHLPPRHIPFVRPLPLSEREQVLRRRVHRRLWHHASRGILRLPGGHGQQALVLGALPGERPLGRLLPVRGPRQVRARAPALRGAATVPRAQAQPGAVQRGLGRLALPAHARHVCGLPRHEGGERPRARAAACVAGAGRAQGQEAARRVGRRDLPDKAGAQGSPQGGHVGSRQGAGQEGQRAR